MIALLARTAPAPKFTTLASGANRRPVGGVYAWGIRSGIPRIKIPLKEPDPDLTIDLGSVWKQAFNRGRYDEVLAYSDVPPSFLRKEDREWARELVAGHG
jgi:hypothetical protein